MHRLRSINSLTLFAFLCITLLERAALASTEAQGARAEKIIIDTDIGSDIDDAFAVALALKSPQVEILGISTASGDTAARARILDRMLAASGFEKIPVAVGAPTRLPFGAPPIGAQTRFGEHDPFSAVAHPAAVDFILREIREFPGQITLIAIGPLTNVGALIDRDPQAFRKLERVVMMGGSIDAGYDASIKGPVPEYNVVADIPAAQKLFQAGVPIDVLPLDSTIHLQLDEVKRAALFSQGTPLTDSLAILYLMWGGTTPILYDAMAVAFVLDPGLCPVEQRHIVVDEKGITRTESGESNARVCLHSDPDAFFHFYMARLH